MTALHHVEVDSASNLGSAKLEWKYWTIPVAKATMKDGNRAKSGAAQVSINIVEILQYCKMGTR